MHRKESSVCLERDLFPPNSSFVGITLEFECTNDRCDSECLNFQKATLACMSLVSILFIFAYGKNIKCTILPSGIVKTH
jgi:hypothetical protein